MSFVLHQVNCPGHPANKAGSWEDCGRNMGKYFCAKLRDEYPTECGAMQEISDQMTSISNKIWGASDKVWRPIRTTLSSPSAPPLFKEQRLPMVQRHTQKLVFNDHQQLAFRNMAHETFRKARVVNMQASAVG